ncbi:hypothetical protein CGLO_08071 [Colletotrichum gloeosporioides Cg-14]|uniref:Uncharacterized protein n=1 Tax=Colletotrichum gloeosporioides (strain Cg-14) TaxID=1237896 RepID=T0LKX6_COLGC|nr:hypothetical protein CGLO_08071 [Colletotrichum gloeosporioides Cg-14]
MAGYYDADRDRYRLVSLRVAGSAEAIVMIVSNAPRGSVEAAVAATVWFTMRARPRLSVTGAQAEDASCDTCRIMDMTRALSPLPCKRQTIEGEYFTTEPDPKRSAFRS